MNTQIITSSKPAGDGRKIVRQKIIAHPLSSRHTVTRQQVLQALMTHAKAKQVVLNAPLLKDMLANLLDPFTAVMKSVQERTLPAPFTDENADDIANIFKSDYGTFVQDLASLLKQGIISKAQTLALLREGSILKATAMNTLIKKADSANLAKIHAIKAAVGDYSSLVEGRLLLPLEITAQEILNATHEW
ncbi:MAG: hypothetical protein ACRC1U_01940 [Vibrionaceae bacterium]